MAHSGAVHDAVVADVAEEHRAEEVLGAGDGPFGSA